MPLRHDLPNLYRTLRNCGAIARRQEEVGVDLWAWPFLVLMATSGPTLGLFVCGRGNIAADSKRAPILDSRNYLTPSGKPSEEFWRRECVILPHRNFSDKWRMWVHRPELEEWHKRRRGQKPRKRAPDIQVQPRRESSDDARQGRRSLAIIADTFNRPSACGDRKARAIFFLSRTGHGFSSAKNSQGQRAASG